MSAARDFYAALGIEIPDRPGEWIDVSCFNPAHPHDDRPSCGINIETGGFKCQACDAAGSAYDAAVLVGRDKRTAQELAECHGLWHNGRGGIVATFDYVDEAGELLFQAVRFEPKDFRQRRPNGDGWDWKLGDTRRVLYHLPAVVKAVEAGETVYVVEGEKDVEALERAGVTATTCPMGAGKWRDEYAECLTAADVTIVADRDEPGRRHARQVADSLAGTASSVRIVEAAEGKDAADHLAAGRSIDEFVEPPPPDPAEHTERSAANPHGERAGSVRSATEHPPNRNRTPRRRWRSTSGSSTATTS